MRRGKGSGVVGTNVVSERELICTLTTGHNGVDGTCSEELATTPEVDSIVPLTTVDGA